MRDTTKETLATLERLVAVHAVSPKHAIEAAYQMGKLDGGLEMARVGHDSVQGLAAAIAKAAS